MDFDEELDVCGEICPVPAVKAKKSLAKLKNGKILKVITDYKPATESVPRYVEKSPHKYLGIEEDEDEDNVWHLFFEVVKN